MYYFFYLYTYVRHIGLDLAIEQWNLNFHHELDLFDEDFTLIKLAVGRQIHLILSQERDHLTLLQNQQANKWQPATKQFK